MPSIFLTVSIIQPYTQWVLVKQFRKEIRHLFVSKNVLVVRGETLYHKYDPLIYSKKKRHFLRVNIAWRGFCEETANEDFLFVLSLEILYLSVVYTSLFCLY